MGIEEIVNSLSSQKPNNLEYWELCIRLTLAGIIGFYITYISYITNINKSNQHRISQAQVLLTVVCALIINVIGYNIAWAIGLIGTLSFIRFRTTLRDPRDTAVFFYSIALGIASGAGEFSLSLVGMLVFTIILFIFKSFSFFKREPFLLKVTGQNQEDHLYFVNYFKKLKIEHQLLDFYKKKKRLIYKIFLASNEIIMISEKLHIDLGEKLIELEKEITEN